MDGATLSPQEVSSLADLPPLVRKAIAGVARALANSTPEQHLLIAQILECDHPILRDVCHVCEGSWNTNHCHAKDPARRIQCQSCIHYYLA